MGNHVNKLSGMKFGRLYVIKDSGERTRKGGILWECLCDCGNKCLAQSHLIKNGSTKSCGCLVHETLKTHGFSGTRIHRIWQSMKTRCYFKLHNSYENYGGRGIVMCEKWKTFEGFYEDMGDPPSDKHQIDRIDNELGYFKENCRWVTASVNMQNKRKRKNTTSKYIGVCYDPSRDKFVAQCKRQDIKFMKRFKTEAEAAIAYNVFALHLYGEDANLNKITLPPAEVERLIKLMEG